MAVQRVQSLQGSILVNHTEFGRELRKLGKRALNWYVRDYDTGFQDGGCGVFAHALHNWSGKDLPIMGMRIVGDPRRTLQHFVVQSGELFLDSDGLATRLEMQAKMHRFNGPEFYEIVPVQDCTGLCTPAVHLQAIARLKEMLASTFGPYAPGLVPQAAEPSMQKRPAMTV